MSLREGLCPVFRLVSSLKGKIHVTPLQIDGIVLRLDCIKRYLVNNGDDSQTDAIITQLEQVIEGLQEERLQYENSGAFSHTFHPGGK